MKIDVLTLFPEFFDSLKSFSVIGRAIDAGILDLEATNIRDFSEDKHRCVDDEVYGGGSGMLMTPQPLYDALESVRKPGCRVIYLSPQGPVLTQDHCIALSKEDHLVLLCGHYEGIDSRIVQNCVDEELSIGDYVLTGGEIPAMVVIDSVSRLIEGTLGNAESPKTDSHYNKLLQYDEYTRPREFRGWKVPEVLFSGNHAEIEKWQQENALEKTKTVRPDLYEAYLKDQ